MELPRCIECGAGVCVCSDEYEGKEYWAAHCMNCDNSIGKRGFYDPCATSKEEAEKLWTNLNKV